MRTDIVHIGANELSYEIRNIVRVAEKLQELGVPVYLENIGDPVAKGEKIPAWMKEIVAELAMEDDCYGYCPTQGLLGTRIFGCHEQRQRSLPYHAGRHHFLQRAGGCHNQNLRVSAPDRPGHNPLSDLHHPFGFRGCPRRTAAGMLSSGPSQQLVSGHR